jgi:hypothetical protein
VDEDGESIIEAGPNLATLVRELQPFCDAGCVCDFTLRDGTNASAILVGISSTSLIVDRWDAARRQPAGDPYVMPLTTIDRVVVF